MDGHLEELGYTTLFKSKFLEYQNKALLPMLSLVTETVMKQCRSKSWKSCWKSKNL
jgi:hypothetical protein